EPLNQNDQGNRYANAAIRALATIGQTEGAALYAVTGNDSLLNLATRVKNKAVASQEMGDLLQQAQLAAQYNDAGALGAAQELIKNGSASVLGEFLVEQAPPALLGFAAGAGAGSVLSQTLTRSTAKYAPILVNMER